MIFGYANFTDFLNSLFKGVNNDLIIKYLLPSIVAIDLMFQFFFDSVGGIWFLIFLYTIDFLTGIAKSINYSRKIYKLNKEGLEIPQELHNKKLVSKKFPRFLFTMFAALLILSILNFAGKHSMIFIPTFSIFYAVFLGQQIISIAENLYEMGLIPYSIFQKLTKKITDFFNND